MRASSNALKSGGDGAAHRLRGVFERLTMPGEALLEECRVPAPGFKELIDGLAREIDETVLPRRLALLSGDSTVATMIVSNRRLLELAIEGRKIKTDASKDASPDRVANSYAQALRALSTRSGPLVLRMVGRATGALTSTEACSARHLSEFSETPYFKNRLKAFLKEIHPASHGWIFQTGGSEAVAHDPDRQVFERLTTLEKKVSSATEARNRVRHLGRQSPSLATFSMSADMQAIVVLDGGDLMIAALPQPDVATAMTHWAKIYGRQKPAPMG